MTSAPTPTMPPLRASSMEQEEKCLTHGPATAPCSYCGKAGAQVCGRCHVDFYCGKEHQKKDWPWHKHGCGVYALRTDPRLGRHLVATKDIPAGTIIMREVPLLAWPWPGRVLEGLKTLCAGCCAVLVDGGFAACAGCGWPVCSEDCSRLPQHQPECAAFQAAGFRMQGAGTCEDWQALAVVRLSLAAKEPSLRPRLLQMQSEFPALDIEHAPLEFLSAYNAEAQDFAGLKREVVRLVRQQMGLQWLQPAEVHRWLGVMRFNTSLAGNAQALYAGAAWLEHSCVPTVGQWADEVAGEAGHRVVTLRDVAAGEHLTLAYGMQPFRWKCERRFYLASTWLFHCECELCADPTDAGLNLGARYCAACAGRGSKQMVTLSANGLVWRCEAEGCGRSGQVTRDRRDCPLHQRLQELSVSNVPLSAWEDFVHQALWPRGPLHATSDIVLRAKEAMIDYEPSDSGEAARLARHCRFLMAAVEKLCPGHILFKLPLVKRLGYFICYQMSNAHSAAAFQEAKAEWFKLRPELRRCAITPPEKYQLDRTEMRIEAIEAFQRAQGWSANEAEPI